MDAKNIYLSSPIISTHTSLQFIIPFVNLLITSFPTSCIMFTLHCLSLPYYIDFWESSSLHYLFFTPQLVTFILNLPNFFLHNNYLSSITLVGSKSYCTSLSFNKLHWRFLTQRFILSHKFMLQSSCHFLSSIGETAHNYKNPRVKTPWFILLVPLKCIYLVILPAPNHGDTS